MKNWYEIQDGLVPILHGCEELIPRIGINSSRREIFTVQQTSHKLLLIKGKKSECFSLKEVSYNYVKGRNW